MATEKRCSPLVPPVRMKIIRTSTQTGPSLHAIEHAVCAPDFEDLVNRALRFRICIRRFPSDPKDWSGLYCHADVEIVITALRRVDKSIIELGGHLRQECVEMPGHISINPTITITYDLKGGRDSSPRTGSVEIAHSSYLAILRINKDKLGVALNLG